MNAIVCRSGAHRRPRPAGRGSPPAPQRHGGRTAQAPGRIGGAPVAEVTEILRQQGDYKKAAEALSEGRIAEGFEELDKLGWIKEVDDGERYQQLASAYLATIADRKPNGEYRTALVVSPSHAEADRITAAIRSG